MLAETMVNFVEVIVDDQPLGNAKLIMVFLDCLSGLFEEEVALWQLVCIKKGRIDPFFQVKLQELSGSG